jgi:hypothetical protein
VLQLLVAANVPSSPILVTLMMEAIRSSETSVPTRATRRNITKGGIHQYDIKVEFRKQMRVDVDPEADTCGQDMNV